MREIALMFVLAWGQEPPVGSNGAGPGDQIKVPSVTIACDKDAQPLCNKLNAKEFEKLNAQVAELKQELARSNALLNWYQQQFFAFQARQIEQQIAPKAPTKPPAQGEPK